MRKNESLKQKTSSKNNLKKVGASLLAVAAIGAPTAAVLGGELSVPGRGNIENPKPLPKVDEGKVKAFERMSAAEKKKAWENFADIRTSYSEKLGSKATSFINNVLGEAKTGTDSPVQVSIEADNNGDGVFIDHSAYQTDALEDGSLRDRVRAHVNKNDGTAINNRDLDLFVEGLYTSDDHKEFDVTQSSINSVTIQDHEAEVYGQDVELTFERSEDGVWDFTITNDGGILFDSHVAGGDDTSPDYSPYEYSQRSQDAIRMLGSIESAYGLSR